MFKLKRNDALMRKLKQSKGFTMFELMVVIAITAILATVAVPSYKKHVRRTYVADGLQAATAYQKLIVGYYTEYSKWPATNVILGLPKWNTRISDTIKQMDINPNGEIVIYYDGKYLDGDKIMVLLPTAENDGSLITWTCDDSITPMYGSGTQVPAELRPSKCR